MQKRIDYLSSQPFLRGVPREQIEMLARESMPTQFTAGELILEDGAPANRFYILLEGQVEIEAPVVEGSPVHIQTIGPGEVLGWSWLFPPYHWHFDARAVTPVKAIFFYGVRLREMCEANPALGYSFMRRISEVVIHRLQGARADLVALHQKSIHTG
jgi:CRP/FNR family transcriptional regulator, cyclic AMP receptor protein